MSESVGMYWDGREAHLVVSEKAALNQVIPLAPAEEHLGIDRVVMQGERGMTSLDTRGKAAIRLGEN